jgi:predicted XRE-type DNA-binding protein
MKKTKFPSEKEISQVRNLLSKGPASHLLSKKATPNEKVKYLICQKLVAYKNKHHLSQRELAQKIGENESLISKIIHYRTEKFTIDRLLKFLHRVYPNMDIELKVA